VLNSCSLLDYNTDYEFLEFLPSEIAIATVLTAFSRLRLPMSGLNAFLKEMEITKCAKVEACQSLMKKVLGEDKKSSGTKRAREDESPLRSSSPTSVESPIETIAGPVEFISQEQIHEISELLPEGVVYPDAKRSKQSIIICEV